MRWTEKERKGEVKQRDPGINWIGAITVRVPSRVVVGFFCLFFFFELGKDGTLEKGNQCVTQK